ncbi:hypothetical protein V2J09_020379 [Rumex salicifolius]
MALTAKDLQNWKDFPKGLRVLLLDEDSYSSAEIQSKLEEMDYIVSAFCSEDEALSSISRSENFHIAIVEVNLNNRDGRFKFLETAKELPTIMISNIDCIATTMKCIALGAIEFLRKPLSDEKLKNIWQHVVHKAFSTAGNMNSESVKTTKDSLVSMLEIQDVEMQDSAMEMLQSEKDQILNNDKFPAPSTPQLKHGGRLVDEMDYQDQANSSIEKENGDHDGDSKFVETTCGKSIAISEPKSLTNSCSKEASMAPSDGTEIPIKETSPPNSSCRPKSSNKKRMKVDWTTDLHKKFVQAVEQLGLEQAIPSRILEIMKVEGLTRHNVASHLQKYRMQRRHILPKQEERRWPHPRPSMQRSYYPLHRPVMAFPPPYHHHSNHTYPPGSQVYPMWSQAGAHPPPGVQMWPPPCYPWQSVDNNWLWKPYPGMHADAWGCPVMPTLQCPSTLPVPEIAPGFQYPESYTMPKSCIDLQPGEEVIDTVVKEAISKPWLPLPIGLKPPSTDSVLAELSKQGITAVPPRSINGRRSF